MFSTREEFFEAIRSSSTDDLLEEWLFSGRRPCIFTSESEKRAFCDLIRADWHETEQLSFAGTSAWRFSLNPNKNFREFSAHSDVDVINVSDSHFCATWDQLRRHHRSVWYTVNKDARESLLRNGENVYSGFISPKWIPDKGNKLRFAFETRLEKYSSKAVGYRKVNMMFFRNATEAKDYYRRGIEIARARI